MQTDPSRRPEGDPLPPEDVDSAPTTPRAESDVEVPVPVVMSPAEVDERAQVIEQLDEDEVSP